VKSLPQKLASALAFLIGAMAVFAGGKVLVGVDPGYPVINWLPLYNYTVGVLSLCLTAVLIWRGAGLAVPAALATLGLHGAVMAILLSAYRQVVAAESIKAMTVRLIAWAVILALLALQRRLTGQGRSAEKPEA